MRWSLHPIICIGTKECIIMVLFVGWVLFFATVSRSRQRVKIKKCLLLLASLLVPIADG